MKPKLSDIVKYLKKNDNVADTSKPSSSVKELPTVIIKDKGYDDSLNLYNASLGMAKDMAKALSKGVYDNNIKYGSSKAVAEREYKKSLDFYTKQLVDPTTKGKKPKFGRIVKYDKQTEAFRNKDEKNWYANNKMSEDNQTKYVSDAFLKGYEKLNKLNKKIKPVSYSLAAELPSVPIYKKPVGRLDNKNSETKNEVKKTDIIKAVKSNQGSDTLFVSDPKDIRLKSYQDSLTKYGFNPSPKMLSRAIREGIYSKGNPKSVEGGISPIEYYKANMNNISKLDSEGKSYAYFQPDITKENSSKFYYDEYGTTRDRKTGKKVVANLPIYKKPTQPVKYKKSEPEKEVKKAESKQEPSKKKNVYEGSPVYSPGVGSGMPSALVGFMSKGGDTSYIQPEDYERFAVPKYGKAFIESKSKKK